MLFRASLAHFIAFGLFCPILFFWASLTHFIAFGLLCPILFFWASSAHFITFGLLCPILFFWASSAYFNSLLPWAFAKSFGLPRPKLPHPLLLGLWAFHQLLTHLIQYFVHLWPILAFLHHILPMGFLFLSSGSFWPVCFLKAHLFILWAYDPLFLPFGLNGFLLNLLTLFFPYC